MSVSAVIRATARWFAPEARYLGECPAPLRVAHYREATRAAGLRHDPEFRLREKAGLRLQRELAFLPIPRHRALVAVGVVKHHEQQPPFPS